MECKKIGGVNNNALKIAGVYTAVILGAGFASGRELMQFFVKHGTPGMLGLLLSGVIFAVIGWFVLDIAGCKRLYSYRELAAYIAGRRLGFALEFMAGLLFWYCSRPCWPPPARWPCRHSGSITRPAYW